MENTGAHETTSPPMTTKGPRHHRSLRGLRPAGLAGDDGDDPDGAAHPPSGKEKKYRYIVAYLFKFQGKLRRLLSQLNVNIFNINTEL